jgi:hypothetical protein
LTITLASFSAGGDASRSDAYAYPWEGSAEYRSLQLSALSGSIEAADRLLLYHSSCIKRGISSTDGMKACSAKVMFWQQIGSENGSFTAAQRNVIDLLDADNSCAAVYRAEHWHKKSLPTYSDDPVYDNSIKQRLEEKKATCRW